MDNTTCSCCNTNTTSSLESDLTAHISDTTVHFTGDEKQNFTNLLSNSAAYALNEDLEQYYTSEQIDERGYLTSIPSYYVTENELELALANYNFSSALGDYYTKSEIDNMDLGSQEDMRGYVMDKLAYYYTKVELDARFEDYYTKTEINSEWTIKTASYTPTVTESSDNAYKIGVLSFNGTNYDIYGKYLEDTENGSGGESGEAVSSYYAMVYCSAESRPNAPTGGTYNFSTNTFTSPTGWSTIIPSDTTTSIWFTYCWFFLNGEKTNWSTPAEYITSEILLSRVPTNVSRGATIYAWSESITDVPVAPTYTDDDGNIAAFGKISVDNDGNNTFTFTQGSNSTNYSNTETTSTGATQERIWYTSLEELYNVLWASGKLTASGAINDDQNTVMLSDTTTIVWQCSATIADTSEGTETEFYISTWSGPVVYLYSGQVTTINGALITDYIKAHTGSIGIASMSDNAVVFGSVDEETGEDHRTVFNSDGSGQIDGSSIVWGYDEENEKYYFTINATLEALGAAIGGWIIADNKLVSSEDENNLIVLSPDSIYCVHEGVVSYQLNSDGSGLLANGYVTWDADGDGLIFSGGGSSTTVTVENYKKYLVQIRAENMWPSFPYEEYFNYSGFENFINYRVPVICNSKLFYSIYNTCLNPDSDFTFEVTDDDGKLKYESIYVIKSIGSDASVTNYSSSNAWCRFYLNGSTIAEYSTEPGVITSENKKYAIADDDANNRYDGKPVIYTRYFNTWSSYLSDGSVSNTYNLVRYVICLRNANIEGKANVTIDFIDAGSEKLCLALGAPPEVANSVYMVDVFNCTNVIELEDELVGHICKRVTYEVESEDGTTSKETMPMQWIHNDRSSYTNSTGETVSTSLKYPIRTIVLPHELTVMQDDESNYYYNKYLYAYPVKKNGAMLKSNWLQAKVDLTFTFSIVETDTETGRRFDSISEKLKTTAGTYSTNSYTNDSYTSMFRVFYGYDLGEAIPSQLGAIYDNSNNMTTLIDSNSNDCICPIIAWPSGDGFTEYKETIDSLTAYYVFHPVSLKVMSNTSLVNVSNNNWSLADLNSLNLVLIEDKKTYYYLNLAAAENTSSSDAILYNADGYARAFDVDSTNKLEGEWPEYSNCVVYTKDYTSFSGYLFPALPYLPSDWGIYCKAAYINNNTVTYDSDSILIGSRYDNVGSSAYVGLFAEVDTEEFLSNDGAKILFSVPSYKYGNVNTATESFNEYIVPYDEDNLGEVVLLRFNKVLSYYRDVDGWWQTDESFVWSTVGVALVAGSESSYKHRTFYYNLLDKVVDIT